MNKIFCRLFVGLMVIGVPSLLAEDNEGSQLSDNKEPSRMKEKVVKARAEKYEENGGVSPTGRKYIYVDQKDIDAATEAARKSGRQGDKEVNIGTTTIGKDDKVRSVDVVVKSDKAIDVKTDGKPTEVNVGQVTLEKDMPKLKKVEVNVIVDAEKGIKVH